jgi:hypothetical protein
VFARSGQFCLGTKEKEKERTHRRVHLRQVSDLDNLVNTPCSHRLTVRPVRREKDEGFDDNSTNLVVRLSLLLLREKLKVGGELVHDLRDREGQETE